jgi:hypothetical protein
MDDLVLIPKVSAGQRNQSSRHGRPKRVTFALRNYGTTCFVAIPDNIHTDGDKVDFYKSSKGFAIQLSPSGTRKVTHRKTNITATLPMEIRTLLNGMFAGSITVPHTAMPNNTFFFSFSDIAAASTK